ncbi:MAG TPA: HNH endonuclease, partial [Candidatus Eisenbacteria bacterium]|nr:HNH endonuclease [Candidatus Eisenbacteria bacterium]
MDEIAVLVLNYTYEPLHFTNARRAVTLLLAGKAESVESSPRVVRSPSRVFPLPSVIRLAVYIRKPFLERVAFNKKNILRRDGYTCQYCSRRGEKLTVDHVMPRSRGGQTTWTNVVAACLRCNLFKGNRTVEEARLRL